jgi:chemotaxis protein CheX
MTEDDLKIFIQGTERFFTNVTAMPAKVSTPYIMESDDRVVYDFSAIIGVSGSQRGCVYYSAPREMVKELVGHLGETKTTDDILADYVGEIANTVSGNARETLGTNFMISVPVVFSGSAGGDVRFPRDIPAFVIPLEWKGHQSSLIIALKENVAADGGADFSMLEDDAVGAEA